MDINRKQLDFAKSFKKQTVETVNAPARAQATLSRAETLDQAQFVNFQSHR